MSIQKTGDWKKARDLLAAGPCRLQQAIEKALAQEAHQLRKEIVQGLTKQAPGGTEIKPPSPWTLAKRRLRGFRGSKSLLVAGDLRNSIAVHQNKLEVFIGISRKARGKTGDALFDVAKLNEFGSDPIVIPITPAMRAFIAKLKQKGKIPTKSGAGVGVVVLQIPARPFLRPAFEAFKRGAQQRFLKRVSKRLFKG